MFGNRYLEVKEEVLNHLPYQENKFLVVKEILDIRKSHGFFEILVSWKWFGKTEDDWINIESLREDVPILDVELLTDL